GVVLQEPYLFSGSIRQNISFNNPDATLEQIRKAAQLAAMHDDILQMPMGYETVISEGGTTLSGGQRQRLSLARALLNMPTVLILDEATSHLDVLTEEKIDTNLSSLSCTRVVIAHRLSTISNADLICVMDQGRIVESGSHKELLAKQGLYARLIQSQIDASFPKN
ncbi:ATP-binding cassette domain-containing protein, partial [bacterium]